MVNDQRKGDKNQKSILLTDGREEGYDDLNLDDDMDLILNIIGLSLEQRSGEMKKPLVGPNPIAYTIGFVFMLINNTIHFFFNSLLF